MLGQYKRPDWASRNAITTGPLHTTEECQIVGKQFSMGEELCRLDDVGMRMHFIPYRKTFSHNLALLRPLKRDFILANREFPCKGLAAILEV